MNAAQLALLQLIAGGGYLPQSQHEYNTLRALYRRRLIRYGWMSVELTVRGAEMLKIHQAKEAS